MPSETKAQTIIAVDIESDGPIPGASSMLALGAVALDWGEKELGAFEVHLEQWPGAIPFKSTMDWWAKQPEAWAHLQTDRVDPSTAMHRFIQWVKPFEPVIYLCGPVGFDFTFVRFYAVQYGNKFPHNAIDLRSYMMGATGSDEYYGNAKGKIRTLTGMDRIKHTHHAVDDARELGKYFFALRRWLHEERIKDTKKKIRGFVIASKREIGDSDLEQIKEEVMENIFGFEPGSYMLTDESRISDFADYGAASSKARKKSVEEYHKRLYQEYGIEVPEGGMYLVEVFRAILDSRRPKH
jgi:hypothetical protein